MTIMEQSVAPVIPRATWTRLPPWTGVKQSARPGGIRVTGHEATHERLGLLGDVRPRQTDVLVVVDTTESLFGDE